MGDPPLALTVELPIPPHALSPNARPHFMERARLKKQARIAAWIAAVAEAQNAGLVDAIPAAGLVAVWSFKTRRLRDEDNLTGWLKAYRDGLADAGVVADDHAIEWTVHVVTIDRDRPEGVRLAIYRAHE